MKIVINITESYYNACKRLQKQGIAQVAEAIIANGKPYEERPQGEWIFNTTWQDYECNNCHNWVRKRQGELPNFCGNCGADMRGGKENEDTDTRQYR